MKECHMNHKNNFLLGSLLGEGRNLVSVRPVRKSYGGVGSEGTVISIDTHLISILSPVSI